MTAVYICALLQEVVLILLSFLSLMVAVYLFSFIGSGFHIVIIPPTDDSCVYMFFFLQEVVTILLAFPSLMVAVYNYVLFYSKWFS